MTTGEFIARLRERGVRLWVEGDRLRYGASAGALTPELREELLERKPDLIRFLLYLQDGEDRALADEGRIARVERNGALPLSFAQQRLWFLQQFVTAEPLQHEGG